MVTFHIYGDDKADISKIKVKNQQWIIDTDLSEGYTLTFGNDITSEISLIMSAFPTDVRENQYSDNIWVDVSTRELRISYCLDINPVALNIIVQLMYQASIAANYFSAAIPHFSLFRKTTISCKDAENNKSHGCNCCIIGILPILMKVTRISNYNYAIKAMNDLHKSEINDNGITGRYQFYIKMVHLLYVNVSIPILVGPMSDIFNELINVDNIIELCPSKFQELSKSITEYYSAYPTVVNRTILLIKILICNI